MPANVDITLRVELVKVIARSSRSCLSAVLPTDQVPGWIASMLAQDNFAPIQTQPVIFAVEYFGEPVYRRWPTDADRLVVAAADLAAAVREAAR